MVPAAGIGSRMGADIPKQYLEINGQTILALTLQRLAAHPRIEAVMVAVSAHDERYSALAPKLSSKCQSVCGGKERCDSVFAGLEALAQTADVNDWVLVHDAARPCLRIADIDHMLNTLKESEVGGILAVPVRDTLKRGNSDNFIADTVERSQLWHAQTPQMFRYGLLHGALRDAINDGVVVTDEAQAVERTGLTPRLINGHADNIKITHPDDLTFAGLVLAAQAKQLAKQQAEQQAQ